MRRFFGDSRQGGPSVAVSRRRCRTCPSTTVPSSCSRSGEGRLCTLRASSTSARRGPRCESRAGHVRVSAARESDAAPRAKPGGPAPPGPESPTRCAPWISRQQSIRRAPGGDRSRPRPDLPPSCFCTAQRQRGCSRSATACSKALSPSKQAIPTWAWDISSTVRRPSTTRRYGLGPLELFAVLSYSAVITTTVPRGRSGVTWSS